MEANESLHHYLFEHFDFTGLQDSLILQHSIGYTDTAAKDFFALHPGPIELNLVHFSATDPLIHFPPVTVLRKEQTLVLTCSCLHTDTAKLCKHQTQALFNIMKRPSIRIFFDAGLRWEKIRVVARDYGLEQEADPDAFFELEYHPKNVVIRPKIKALLPVTDARQQLLQEQLLPRNTLQLPQTAATGNSIKNVLVLSKHKYYEQYRISLYQAEFTINGRLKKMPDTVDPSAFVWTTEDAAMVRFYAAVAKLQHSYEAADDDADLAVIKAVVQNPQGLPVYIHQPETSAHVTPLSLLQVQLQTLDPDIRLTIDQQSAFYEITGQLFLHEKAFDLQLLNIRYHYFLLHQQVLYLMDHPDLLRIIRFFKKHSNKILLHQSKFEAFQETILNPLGHRVTLTYSYLKPATTIQLSENNFDKDPVPVLYLSDAGNHVLLTPVMKYGDVEVPVLSKCSIRATDKNGTVFTVARNTGLEVRFTALLLEQHPDFKEQLHNDCFYLHRRQFLDQEWFLGVFEHWQNNGITILGFDKLEKNKWNPHKARISVQMASGTDWFETHLKVVYGRQVASLKQLHKAIRNKSRFVVLGDGTHGILPQEWIEKMAGYFQGGEIVAETIRIPKINFSEVQKYYAAEVLSAELKEELSYYQAKMAGFNGMEEVPVPEGLQATLRDYQRQGLNWLNFLDTFNFGGCLADDMGLGKTIQIIAFILSQRGKQPISTNLIVVPATLIFNWQDEIEKFAPSLKVQTLYGPGRVRNAQSFEGFDIILTAYSTLLQDIRFLKNYRFNYIFLDESQNIKNPESQRYQAVRLLQSRNKVVLTGTPVENNTFDLYGQLSFACPGLLGSVQYFREQFATPIDKFKDDRRAGELQQKVSPFILRRTKRQVAKELPEKTEMVVYCEMGAAQKAVYDYYKKEYRDFLLSKQEDELMKYNMHVLKGLTVLRQICNDPALLKDPLMAGNGSAKMDFLLEEIENRSGQHKILIFSQFVGMLDLIKEQLTARGIAHQYLTGQTRNRAERVAHFQQDDTIRVFLISLKAGGTGLNLTEADYVYIIDPWWNPAVENQAIDRCYRIGQKKNVVAVRLICPDTVEEKIMRLQQTKTDLINGLVKTESPVMGRLSGSELIDLFR